MGRALNATGRKIFYSVEGWSPDQGDWGPELANMWRTGSDIWPFWDTCILHNLYQTNIAAPYNRYGQSFYRLIARFVPCLWPFRLVLLSLLPSACKPSGWLAHHNC